MMIFVAAVMPMAFAMHLWPVGGFAAERVFYDSRINYKQSDTTVYRFHAPVGEAHVRARLIYYRHWNFMEPLKGSEFWGADKWKYLLHEVAVTALPDAKKPITANAGNHEVSLAEMPPVPSTPGAGAMRLQAAGAMHTAYHSGVRRQGVGYLIVGIVILCCVGVPLLVRAVIRRKKTPKGGP